MSGSAGVGEAGFGAAGDYPQPVAVRSSAATMGRAWDFTTASNIEPFPKPLPLMNTKGDQPAITTVD